MKKELIIVCTIFLLYACDKDESAIPENPTAVDLVFPFENSECNEGTNITATESTVLFEWSTSLNTDEYELNLTDLTTGDSTTHITSDMKISITIKRATPYGWYVVSKSSSVATTAQSATWKFYNAGEGIKSYPPFPAEIVSPAMTETITTPASVTLEWKGSDVDGDIVGYDVYFGTASPPGIFENDLQVSILNIVPISSNTVYYWKIITKDAHGNSSDSGIYQFKTI